MTPPIRRAYIDNIYGQVHYRVARPEGAHTKPALLCIHQSPRSGWEWEPIMPGIAADRAVLAPDTPGYGASDPPPEPVRIEDYAAAMARFMDDMVAAGDIPGGQFDIIGYHTGSLTATHMALMLPQRVRRIILIGLAAFDTPTRLARAERKGFFPTPKDNDLSHVTRLWDLSQTMTDARASPQWRHAALVEGLRPGERLPWGFSAVYAYDFQGAMAQVTQQALIINPQDDLFDITAANAHRFANGREVRLMGAAHGLLALDTEPVVSLIRDFLDEPG